MECNTACGVNSDAFSELFDSAFMKKKALNTSSEESIGIEQFLLEKDILSPIAIGWNNRGMLSAIDFTNL